MKRSRQFANLQQVCSNPLRLSPGLGIQRYSIHNAAVPSPIGGSNHGSLRQTAEMAPLSKPPLSILPLTTLLRSFLITSFSSYPLLLNPSLAVLSRMGKSSSALLSPDRNRLLHFLLKKTFYAHFCAGETPQEVRATIRGLKDLGFRGVILSHGKEVVLERGQTGQVQDGDKTHENEDSLQEQVQIEAWRNGILKTVEMMEKGDYAAIKFSGAGNAAIRQLSQGKAPTPSLQIAIEEICQLAKQTGVRLMIDAEQQRLQEGIHVWTLDLQRKHNTKGPLVFDTYQTYLRSVPLKLAAHLHCATSEGFSLGVKLVRGAYMASDPPAIFWENKAKTDKIFDGITAALLKGRWNDTLQSLERGFDMPPVEVVLATHNEESVRKAVKIQAEQKAAGKGVANVSYGQLMGMADELSCELLLESRTHEKQRDGPGTAAPSSSAYKYLTWGSVQECLKYLVRRAQENRDAMFRARQTRRELGRELLRRAGLLDS